MEAMEFKSKITEMKNSPKQLMTIFEMSEEIISGPEDR